MENVYTYEQIIFALRKEYLNIQEQLNQLKNYIITNKRVENYYFNMKVDSKDLIKIYLDYELKLYFLDSLMNKYGIDNSRRLDVTKGAKKTIYKIDQKKIFTFTERELFNGEVENLINSEYAKEISKNRNVISNIVSKGEKYVTFNWNKGLSFVDSLNPYYSRLDYNLISDYIYVSNNDGNVSIDEITKILNYKVDVSKFSDYCKDLFKNMEYKDVVIDATFNNNEERLSILETPKSYVLTNKK